MARKAVRGGAAQQVVGRRVKVPKPDEKFTLTFAVTTEAGIKAVSSFAKHHQLRVVAEHPERRLVVVRGRARQIAKAFMTDFVRVRLAGGKHIRIVGRQATLPSRVAQHVAYVHGLVGYPPRKKLPTHDATSRLPVGPGGRPHGDRSLRRAGWSPPGRTMEVTLFARRPKAVARIARYAKDQGLNVTADRKARTLVIGGTSQQIGEFFAVRFVTLSNGGEFLRGVTSTATLPAPIARQIAYVFGLQTYPPPARKGITGKPDRSRYPKPRRAADERSRTAGAIHISQDDDQFDLDIRLSAPAVAARDRPLVGAVRLAADFTTECFTAGCGTPETCDQHLEDCGFPFTFAVDSHDACEDETGDTCGGCPGGGGGDDGGGEDDPDPATGVNCQH